MMIVPSSNLVSQGFGYLVGFPLSIGAGKGEGQIPNIYGKAHNSQIAIWDKGGFYDRFGQSVHDCVLDALAGKYPYLSEHFKANHPCKLFCDIDMDAALNPHRDVFYDVREMALDFIRASNEAFRAESNVVIPDLNNDAVILYASTAEKGSAHVILQIAFHNVKHVRNFIERCVIPRLNKELFKVNKLQTKEGEEPKVISVQALDMNVYKDAGGLLRACYASKLEKGKSKCNPLLPWGVAPDAPKDAKLFVQSLLCAIAYTPADKDMLIEGEYDDSPLQYMYVASTVWRLADLDVGTTKTEKTKAKKTKVLGSPDEPVEEEEEEEYPMAEELVTRFVQNFPPLAKQARLRRFPVKANPAGTLQVHFIVKSRGNPNAIKCKYNEGAHRSNCVYFHLNLSTFIGFWACPDPDCRNRGGWDKASYKRYFMPQSS